MARFALRATAPILALATTLALAGCTAQTEAPTTSTSPEAPAVATSPEAPAPSGSVSSPASPSTISPAAVDAAITAGAVTVSARSEVKVVPDKASFGFGVDNEGPDAETVQSENARVMNAVVARLKELGIDEKSIQTSWTNLSPIWDYESQSDRITGYSMNTRVQVSDLDVDRVGEIMQECVAAGATNVDGPQFYASNYNDAYQEALAAAVTATRPKAEAIAAAAGVSVGRVVGVAEGYQDFSVYYGAAAADSAMGAVEEALSVEPGEVSIEASVTVSYEIA